MAGLAIAAPAPIHLAMLAVFVFAQSVRMGLEEKALRLLLRIPDCTMSAGLSDVA
jgi:hypothetical protein